MTSGNIYLVKRLYRVRNKLIVASERCTLNRSADMRYMKIREKIHLVKKSGLHRLFIFRQLVGYKVGQYKHRFFIFMILLSVQYDLKQLKKADAVI